MIVSAATRPSSPKKTGASRHQHSARRGRSDTFIGVGTTWRQECRKGRKHAEAALRIAAIHGDWHSTEKLSISHRASETSPAQAVYLESQAISGLLEIGQSIATTITH